MMKPLPLIAAAGLLAFVSTSWAQKSAADGIAEYRKMLEDGNPAELFEAKGESLWKTPRGPKKVSLQTCDLGLGPGVVKGAWVQLPRYFADTGRVQDLESRLLTCMETLQGFDPKAIASTPFGRGEQITMEALAAWISAESKGMRFSLSQGHAAEKTMYELGRRAFFLRARLEHRCDRAARVDEGEQAAVEQAVAACGGELRATIRALIVANNYLENEVAELMKAISHAYTRGRFQAYSG